MLLLRRTLQRFVLYWTLDFGTGATFYTFS